METFSSPSSLAFLVLISLSFFFALRRCRKGGRENAPRLPPGSLGWPIVGETLHFLVGKPEKFVHERMKRYSPDIFKTKIFGETTAVLCGPNGHKFLFTNEGKIFNEHRPLPMQRLFRSYNTTKPGPRTPANLKTVRQVGFLKPEALVRYLAEMDSIARDVLQSLVPRLENEVKAYSLAKTVTLTLSCRFFLGIDRPERIAKLVEQFDDVSEGMHSVVLDFPGTTFHRASRAAEGIRRELKHVINEKRAAISSGNVTRDILSYMIVTPDANGQYSPEAEIADKMMGFVIAGYSTLATTIAFLMKFVGERPEIYEKIRKEQTEIADSKPGEFLQWEDVQKMKYSWNVVCETIRLAPPLQGTFREAIADFTYAGYTVPKGWKVYWSASTTHRDPAYFQDPDEFNPSRYDEGREMPPYTYVPFGGGPRLCPGKEYARLAILAFVHNMVRMYRWEVLFPDEKVVGDMMPIPEKGIPIRLHRH